ncbi:MAG TPA: hypothetical protein VIN38_00895 [Thiobacillus sp.]
MNTLHDTTTQENLPPIPSANAAGLLENNREILRQRLWETRARDDSSVMGYLGAMTDSAAPAARQWVRQHPYASLSAAALTGALLVRLKPWNALGGSILLGLLVRQALAASLSHGGQILSLLFKNTTQSTHRPNPKQFPADR